MTHLRDRRFSVTLVAMVRRVAFVSLLLLSCAPRPSNPPAAPPGPAPTAPPPAPTEPPPPAPTAPAPAPTAGGGSTQCDGPPPGPGYECVRDCGPPVARQDDPPPGWSWLSSENAEKRRRFGCPICLPASARIATPSGERPVATLERGDPIWTLDAHGQRIAGRVLYVGSTPVSGRHTLVRVTLADGRVIAASPGHPTLDGRTLAELRDGQAFAGARVRHVEHVRLDGDRTYDVLPSGATGAYWVDGVLLSSSFAGR